MVIKLVWGGKEFWDMNLWVLRKKVILTTSKAKIGP